MEPDTESMETFNKKFKDIWDSYSFTAPEDVRKKRDMFALMYQYGWDAAISQMKRSGAKQ